MASKGEQTRHEIVAAAKLLFYRRGYSNTSFSDIVAVTGVQRGNIYHYFKTKDDILAAVIEQRLDEYETALHNWDQEYSDPKDRLRRFVQMVASNRGELAQYGCPIGTLGAELGKEYCDLQGAARRLFDLFRDWLAEQFRQLGKPKQAKSLSLHLLGRTQGISVIGHVYAEPALITAETKSLQKWVDEV